MPRLIAHIAEVEESQIDVEENVVSQTIEDNALSTEFAAVLLNNSNDIHFTTYAMSSISELSQDQFFALSSLFSGYNSVLNSACTNHIFQDLNVFHTYEW